MSFLPGGRVVKAKFETRIGYRVLMTLVQADGKPVPFGATVSILRNGIKDKVGDSGFIVGEEGQLYLNGLEAEGLLLAKWGQGKEKQCEARYQLKDSDINSTKPQLLITTNSRCM